METRPLRELINTEEPAWPDILRWVHEAKNHVEVLPVDRARGESVLLALQVTTRSPMGAIALESGGFVVDHGWLRILGAGHPRLAGDLAGWNGLEPRGEKAWVPHVMIVAYDVIGGFYAINGGGLAGPRLNAFYFAPGSLRWEDLGRGYSDLLHFLFDGDLSGFYADARWPGWQEEVASLSGDRGISIWPPPSAMGPSFGERSRAQVPIRELWGVQQEIAKSLGA